MPLLLLERIQMKTAESVMNDFMDLLSSNGFEKDIQTEDSFEINQQFVDETVSEYSNFLKSGFLELISPKERRLAEVYAEKS